MMMNMNIIDVQHVSKVYTTGDIETRALSDISFSVKKGEYVAIMGPSGSGKSTLMHILGALDTPTSGTYFLNGKDVSEQSDDDLADVRLKEIGFVFQAFNLLPRTSVLRNVMLPLVYAEVPEEERLPRAEYALRSVALDEGRWQHHSNQISGGQKQRVAIARALVNNPSIILADEPTGNLDTKTGHMVLDTFRRLNEEEGHTIILITHEDEVAEHADRMIVIRDGKIERDTRR